MARTVSKKNAAKYRKVTGLVDSGMVLHRALKKMKCSYTSYTNWYRNNNKRLFNKEDMKPVAKREHNSSKFVDMTKKQMDAAFKEILENIPVLPHEVKEVNNTSLATHVTIEYRGATINCRISQISMIMDALNSICEQTTAT